MNSRFLVGCHRAGSAVFLSTTLIRSTTHPSRTRRVILRARLDQRFTPTGISACVRHHPRTFLSLEGRSRLRMPVTISSARLLSVSNEARGSAAFSTA